MTVASIRTGFLNKYLGIAVDGEALPWPSADRDIYIGQALAQAWPDIGKRASAVAATAQGSDVYTIPLVGGVTMKISRIELEQTLGGILGRAGKVTNWQTYSDTQVRITPHLATVSGLNLRFFGWVPYLVDATDIPARLESTIAMRAAAIAYGVLAGQLVNLRRQQGLDSPRVVDYQTAVGLSAYWERRYFEQVQKDPARIAIAPRRGRR